MKRLICTLFVLLLLSFSLCVAAFGEAVSETGESDGLWLTIGISGAAGFIVAFIVTGIMRSQLNGAKLKSNAHDYVKRESLDIRVSRDLFLYRTVSKVPKPQNKPSGK